MLESPKDWEEWYEVVSSLALTRGIASLVDINKAIAPIQLESPAEPLISSIDADAQSFIDLTGSEKDHFKVLISQHQMRMRAYEKQQKAITEVLDFIQGTVARNLRPYMRKLGTPYAILRALKKRLAPTDRARRLELSRELQALKKAPRAQALDKWLLQWETIYAEAEDLNLADIQDHKALYDFIFAIKSVDSAYASAYQVYVDTKLEDEDAEESIPTLYDAVERFRNNLRLNRASTKTYTHSAFATL